MRLAGAVRGGVRIRAWLSRGRGGAWGRALSGVAPRVPFFLESDVATRQSLMHWRLSQMKPSEQSELA